MKEILFGVIAGIVTGMGIGGGTILILLLTIFTNMNQHVAQATNLIFFIPTAIVTIIMSAKKKLIEYKTANTIIIFGILGSMIGAYISSKIDNRILRKLFGIALLSIAIYEIYSYKKQYKKT